MRTTAVITMARKLRRVTFDLSYASMVPDHLPHDPVKVGDLPEYIFMKIAAIDYAESLSRYLREWINQGGHK